MSDMKFYRINYIDPEGQPAETVMGEPMSSTFDLTAECDPLELVLVMFELAHPDCSFKSITLLDTILE